MLQKFLFQKILLKRRTLSLRGGTSRILRFFIVLTVMIVGLGLINPQAAGAKPNPAWMTATIVVYPGGDLTLCKGEKKHVNVFLKVRTYRLFGGIGGIGSTPPNQLIWANSSSSQVASISPGSMLTTLGQANPSGYVPSLTSFQIKAIDVGSTLLTFSDGADAGSSIFSGSAPDRPRADPKFVTVTVKECVFEVTALSKWQLPEGFKPILSSQFSWVVKPDQDGKFDESNILVTNSAVLGEHYFASGYTTEEIVAFASTVRIYGQVDWDARTITINLKYDPVRGKIILDCPACLRPVHGESDDFGSPETLGFIGPNDGFSLDSTHKAVYSGGTTTGTIKISVVRKYQ